jgi:hypothetical protein
MRGVGRSAATCLPFERRRPDASYGRGSLRSAAFTIHRSIKTIAVAQTHTKADAANISDALLPASTDSTVQAT